MTCQPHATQPDTQTCSRACSPAPTAACQTTCTPDFIPSLVWNSSLPPMLWKIFRAWGLGQRNPQWKVPPVPNVCETEHVAASREDVRRSRCGPGSGPHRVPQASLCRGWAVRPLSWWSRASGREWCVCRPGAGAAGESTLMMEQTAGSEFWLRHSPAV